MFPAKRPTRSGTAAQPVQPALLQEPVWRRPCHQRQTEVAAGQGRRKLKGGESWQAGGKHIESGIVELERSCGILLHPTSLPGPFGIGDLGVEAYRFIHSLFKSGVSVWQVLPLGPTGYGDSPYQCFSAFAGNPLLISLEMLVEEGLLSRSDLAGVPSFRKDRVDYGAVIDFKLPLLKKAYENFKDTEGTSGRKQFEEFCRNNESWLEDYALFRAVKDAHDGVQWTRWEPAIARREPEALARWREEKADQIQMRRFWQFEFFKQWGLLRDFARELNVQIMGDIPIFVAHDSSDVWAAPNLFHLNEDGRPVKVAGVPPDYFSASGQLWGNPLYRWRLMASEGFQWWIDRFRSAFSLFDLIRVDHFRGFEAFWEVPGEERTAINGRWVHAPGEQMFEAVENALGQLPIVAENLGWITPEVEALRKKFGFPGMGILQFAFGTDPQASDFIPHNHVRDMVIYTGTHDNNTTVGWWTATAAQDSTRSQEEIEAERDLARRYLRSDDREIHWELIRAAMASVAVLAIVPFQDLYGLGSEARMNLPGRPDGNWTWRVKDLRLEGEVSDRLLELTWLYGRRAVSQQEAAPEKEAKAAVSQ